MALWFEILFIYIYSISLSVCIFMVVGRSPSLYFLLYSGFDYYLLMHMHYFARLSFDEGVPCYLVSGGHL